jgi:hypothetical protein
VRVTQLSGHVELEILVVLNGVITESDVPRAALLENLLLKDGLNCGIHFLTHIFHHAWSTKRNGIFKITQVVRVGELQNFNLATFLHVTDPLVSLTLRINEERPSSSLLINDSIFN